MAVATQAKKNSNEPKRRAIEKAFRELQTEIERLSDMPIEDAEKEIGIKGFTKRERYLERHSLPI